MSAINVAGDGKGLTVNGVRVGVVVDSLGTSITAEAMAAALRGVERKVYERVWRKCDRTRTKGYIELPDVKQMVIDEAQKL